MQRWTSTVLATCAAALFTGAAWAHDSWLARDARGAWVFVTGSRYPLADAGTVPARPMCRSRGGASACWAELPEHTIELDAALVDVYLKEIRPPQDVLDAWSSMKEAGLPWRESYRKFARIESGSAQASALAEIRRPAGQPLEIVIEGDAPLAPGRAVSFRVLSDGQPVKGFAVELVSAKSPLGVWQRTDGEGRIRHVLPFGGEWVLRGTWLDRDGDRWRSRFVTLAFTA